MGQTRRAHEGLLIGVPTAPPILSVNEKMIELFARPELRLQPMRLLSTAGPFFSGIIWVPIFRKNPRIATARALGRVLKEAQTFFELGLLLGDLASKCRSKLFVQMPQFIYGHGIECFHEMDPPVLFLPSAKETGQSSWHGNLIPVPD